MGYLPQYPVVADEAKPARPARWLVFLGAAGNLIGAIVFALGIVRDVIQTGSESADISEAALAGAAALTGGWVIVLNVTVLALWALALTRILGGSLFFANAVRSVLVALLPIAVAAGAVGGLLLAGQADTWVGPTLACAALGVSLWLLTWHLRRYGGLRRSKAITATALWISAPGVIVLLSWLARACW